MTERDIQPRVGASLVLWHSNLELVCKAVSSLIAQETAVTRIAIVVNEDPDSDVTRQVGECLRPLIPSGTKLIVHAEPGNSGFAGGQNIALATLFDDGCAHVLVLNPDVLLDPTCMTALVTFATERDRALLVGPLLERASSLSAGLAPQGTIDSAGIRWTKTGRHLDDLQDQPISDAPRVPRQVRGITGAAMLVTADAYRRLIQASGEFFDGAFIAYREDAELGLRAEACQVEMWLVPAARALHVRQQRGTGRGDRHIDRLSVRNRFLIATKHGWTKRPGGLGAVARDVLVITGVLVREHSSWAGVADAWRLRHEMRTKGRRLRESTRSQS